MKLTICVLVLAAAIAMTRAEECQHTSDCSHVSCPENDYQLECHNHQCTCTHTSATCNTANDCNDPDCHRPEHCVDGKCRCGFGFGGIGK